MIIVKSPGNHTMENNLRSGILCSMGVEERDSEEKKG